MKKLLFWMVLIVGIVALMGSCAKKEDGSTDTTATTATTYVSTDTAASGSLTVGSETMSGTYVTECITSVDTMVSSGSLLSDAKTLGRGDRRDW